MKREWQMSTAAVLASVVVSAAGVAAAGSTEDSSTDREAVIKTAQALFDAMAAHDGAKIRQLLLPEATLNGLDSRNRATFTRVTTADAFAKLMEETKDTLLERMRNPEVRVGGDLATLWAPYEFHGGGKFSHCGHDAFQFVRGADGLWRIATISFTMYVDPKICQSLK